MIGILLNILSIIFRIFEYAIIVEVILSWVLMGRENNFTEIVHKITEPFMMPGRKIQNLILPNGFMLDFSPIFALLILAAVRWAVFTIILRFL